MKLSMTHGRAPSPRELLASGAALIVAALVGALAVLIAGGAQ